MKIRDIFLKLLTLMAGQSSLQLIRPDSGLAPTIDRKRLIDEFKSWAFICAGRNASAIASVPLRLYATRAVGEGKARRRAKTLSSAELLLLKANPALAFNARLKEAEDVEEIFEHPVLNLLKSVNPYENAFETMEKTAIFLDCTGDAYWHIMFSALGVPTEIYLLPSQWVIIVPDKNKYIRGYLYGDSPQTRIPLMPDEVIHFRAPNPRNLFYGMGCIEAAASAITRQGAYDRMELALADNSGIAPFLIRHESSVLGVKQQRDLEAMWNNYLKGYSRAGKIKIIGKEWDIKDVALSPREMSFAEGRRWTRLEITDAFGVPVALLDTENVNLANAKTALYQYQKFTIAPRICRLDEKLNEQLIAMYDEPRIFLAHDSPVPADEEFDLRRDDIFLQRGVLTVNEIRKRLGWEPVAWGDEPMPAGGMALGAGFASQVTSGGEGNPSLGKGKAPGRMGDEKGSVGTGTVPPLTRAQSEIRGILQRIFRQQEAYWTANLYQLGKQFVGACTKLAEDWDTIMADETEDELEKEMVRGALAGWKKIPAGTRPKIGSAAEHINRPEFAAWARTHTIKFARAVNATTDKKLRTALGEGFDAGEGIEQLKDRVREVFRDATANRAEAIARTESARAVTGGELEIYRASGVVNAREWSAAGDACPFCRAMHGKVLPLGDANYFERDGQMAVSFQGETLNMTFDYEAIAGPPLHPNCRCDLLPVLKEVG